MNNGGEQKGTGKLKFIISNTNGKYWSAPVLIEEGVNWGDVGIAYNKRLKRLIVVYWKDDCRRYAYSDDMGKNWTFGWVDGNKE